MYCNFAVQNWCVGEAFCFINTLNTLRQDLTFDWAYEASITCGSGFCPTVFGVGFKTTCTRQRSAHQKCCRATFSTPRATPPWCTPLHLHPTGPLHLVAAVRCARRGAPGGVGPRASLERLCFRCSRQGGLAGASPPWGTLSSARHCELVEYSHAMWRPPFPRARTGAASAIVNALPAAAFGNPLQRGGGDVVLGQRCFLPSR